MLRREATGCTLAATGRKNEDSRLVSRDEAACRLPSNEPSRMTTAAAQARYPLTQGVNPWLVAVSVVLPTFTTMMMATITNKNMDAATGLIYGLMEQQSAMLAYIDVFRWTAVLALVCACAAWLFKKPAKYAKPPPGMH